MAEACLSRWNRDGLISNNPFRPIYRIRENDSNRIAVLKQEVCKGAESHLLHEIEVYEELCQSGSMPPGFPHLIQFDKKDNLMFLITAHLGDTLLDRLKIFRGRLPLPEVCALTLQLLDRLETLHAYGYVHRDVCVSHVAFGREAFNKTERVYLLGLGNAAKFTLGGRSCRGTGELSCRHVTAWEGIEHRGCELLRSTNCHNACSYARRDDVESLGYLFLLLVNGELPWSGLCVAKPPDVDEVVKCKTRMSVRRLCRGLPGELRLFFQHVNSLSFEDMPDYQLLRQLMWKMVEECEERSSKSILRRFVPFGSYGFGDSTMSEKHSTGNRWGPMGKQLSLFFEKAFMNKKGEEKKVLAV